MESNTTMDNPTRNVGRRGFLKSSVAMATSALLSGSKACPAYAKPQRIPASDRVNVALVGIGGKGGNNRKMLQATGMCNVVALCDVDLHGPRTQAARFANGEVPGKTASADDRIEPSAAVFSDFRVMFDKMAHDIDAVVVSTPDHTHFPVAMLAMSLGKHVWVEKPLAHSFGQCQRLMDLANRSGVVTQMGNQGHSSVNFTQFQAWKEAGLFDHVERITAYMNNPRRWHGWGESVTGFPSEELPRGLDWDMWVGAAPYHPYSSKLHPGNWRSWFDYGSGAFGDWGPHILDTCHRFLDLGYPKRLTAIKRDGANPFVFPQASTIQFEFPRRGKMPACSVTWCDGVENSPESDARLGSLSFRKPGKLIYTKNHVFQGDSHGSVLRVVGENRAEVEASLPHFPTEVPNHWENFLLACRGLAEPASPFQVSGPLTQVFNLGVICQRLGGSFTFDNVTHRISNNDEANLLLDPPPRKGWEEFYQM